MARSNVSPIRKVSSEKHPTDLLQTLANHDADIKLLGGQLNTLQTEFRQLSGEVHTGFSAVSAGMQEVKGMMAQINVRPTLDIQKMAATTLIVLTLLGMCITTIVWVNTLQSAALLAEVKGNQALINWRLEQSEKDLRYLGRQVNTKAD